VLSGGVDDVGVGRQRQALADVDDPAVLDQDDAVLDDRSRHGVQGSPHDGRDRTGIAVVRGLDDVRLVEVQDGQLLTIELEGVTPRELDLAVDHRPQDA